MLRRYLTTFDSFMLYTTSVVGLGLIVLPSIAARAVGAWSIVIWIALGLLSFPMARVMGELGRRHPSAGGVTEFIGVALGPRTADLTSVLYLVAMLVGPVASSLFFAEYLGVLVELGRGGRVIAGAGFLWALVGLNLMAVETTTRLQRALFFGFFLLAAAGVALSMTHVDPARLVAFHGVAIGGILSMTFLCFHAFIGWEHAAFSSEEMVDPASLVKAVTASVVVVTATFAALGIAVVGAVAPDTLARSNAALADLLAASLGDNASLVTAGVAIVVIFMMMLTWVRGGSRLLYATARRGLAPGALSRVNARTGAPAPALIALGVAWTLSLAVYYVFGVDVQRYLRLANANYIMTYLFIFVAAVRLLRHEARLLASAAISLAAVIFLLAIGYADLWYPALTAVLFFAVTYARSAFRTAAAQPPITKKPARAGG